MRVLVDANVFISYLLQPGGTSPVVAVVEAVLRGVFTLLLPPELLSELLNVVAEKPYLSRRIPASAARLLVDALEAVGELIPPIPPPFPIATRDPKDDYLLAYALVGRADRLVTGDEDLLVVGQVGALRIVSPAALVDELRG